MYPLISWERSRFPWEVPQSTPMVYSTGGKPDSWPTNLRLKYLFPTHIFAAFLVDDISYKLLGPICMAADVIQHIRYSALSWCQREREKKVGD